MSWDSYLQNPGFMRCVFRFSRLQKDPIPGEFLPNPQGSMLGRKATIGQLSMQAAALLVLPAAAVGTRVVAADFFSTADRRRGPVGDFGVIWAIHESPAPPASVPESADPVAIHRPAINLAAIHRAPAQVFSLAAICATWRPWKRAMANSFSLGCRLPSVPASVDAP